jgi:hypothetical protein
MVVRMLFAEIVAPSEPGVIDPLESRETETVWAARSVRAKVNV